MSAPVIATKLYIPPPRPKAVPRPRLIERLNEGLHHKLTLISAPAGFGKTTLVSSWIDALRSTKDDGQSEAVGQEKIVNPKSKIVNRVAWLSLDEADNDPARFLIYLISALQTIVPTIGQGLLIPLHSPQPPPIESILTTLLNEITTVSDKFVLVFDDYHVIDAKPVEQALNFLLEHLPPLMHLVIVTREDPPLPLARLRARGQVNELRAANLRFTPAEAAEFLNQAGLTLSPEDLAALETRTEGWIAGLQLAAISMQGHHDASSFIQSFTGGHHFVMDYLVEEVLQQQPERVQTFLLRTSILDRLCGPLCDAVLPHASAAGQETLAYLERANLFLIPLDNERRWYRYHHLFADLLRQRLQQSLASTTEDAARRVNELHIRASQWYEDSGLDIEAFHHAAAANDIERAERLIEGRGIPLHLRGAVTAILDWFASLPKSVLDARPSLWWRYGALQLVNGQTTGVEEKLDAAEAALQDVEPDDKTRLLIGRIAAARATLALTRYQADTMLTQSRRALDFLPPTNLSLRANAHWTMGYGYFIQGDRAAARRAYTEAIALGQAARDVFTIILATIGLGMVQEGDNQLYEAAETYRRVLHMAGDQPLQIIYEAHLGLARVLYEWNDLAAAEQHGRQSLHLARQYDTVIDRFIVCEVFLACLKLAEGDVASATTMLAQASQTARQKNFVHRIPEVAAAQVVTLLRQDNLSEAAQLAQAHALPISQARVALARGDATVALALLESVRQQAEARGWEHERLRVMALKAVAYQASGDKDQALRVLGDALALAEPGGFIRLFVDEGEPMAHLLSAAMARGMKPDYIGKLLAAIEDQTMDESSVVPPSSIVHRPSSLVEPLSQRELEILRLIAQGLSNSEISERLFLALSTVKGHSGRIFGKLQVQSRTQAVARARELGLL